MKVYTNIEFSGHYPVGTAAVVVAKNPENAAVALNEVLVLRGLAGDARHNDMVEIDTDFPTVRILNDGNY